MAKPTYKVWFVNQVKTGTKIYDPADRNYYFTWDQSMLTKTAAELKSLFDAVCKHAQSKFDHTDVDVQDLATAAAGIQTGELIIRFTTKSASALIAKYGANAVNKETTGGTKDVGGGSGTISEAWLEGAAGSATVPELLARLAFHELMHNKIDASNSKDIHNSPDDGTGLAGTPVAYDTALTETNKKNMALRLGNIGKQFTAATIP